MLETWKHKEKRERERILASRILRAFILYAAWRKRFQHLIGTGRSFFNIVRDSSFCSGISAP